jgi:hypothetical protein
MDSQRDPLYTPFGKPQPARPRDPGDVICTFRREGVERSCELLFRGESYGWEARVLTNDDLVNEPLVCGARQAVEWSQTQQADIECRSIEFEAQF